jgi:hypothetical protein
MIYYVLSILSLLVPFYIAMAVTISSEHLAEKEYAVVVDMPSTWDGDLDRVKIHAYYGTYDDGIGGNLTKVDAVGVIVEGFPKNRPKNITLQFDPYKLLFHPETGKAFHHIEVSFKKKKGSRQENFEFIDEITK